MEMFLWGLVWPVLLLGVFVASGQCVWSGAKRLRTKKISFLQQLSLVFSAALGLCGLAYTRELFLHSSLEALLILPVFLVAVGLLVFGLSGQNFVFSFAWLLAIFVMTPSFFVGIAEEFRASNEFPNIVTDTILKNTFKDIGASVPHGAFFIRRHFYKTWGEYDLSYEFRLNTQAVLELKKK